MTEHLLAPDGTEGIRIDCPCGQVFRAPRSMAGGLANCPRCQQAQRVEARIEWDWTLLLAIGGAVVLVVAAGIWLTMGWIAGVVALVIGGAILAAVIAAS